jgi:hypothetical protein
MDIEPDSYLLMKLFLLGMLHEGVLETTSWRIGMIFEQVWEVRMMGTGYQKILMPSKNHTENNLFQK